MLLDLRGIIDLPGGRVSFDFEPDLTRAAGGSVVRIKENAAASGNVTNNASLLTFSCDIEAVLVCVCARCLKEFEYPVNKTVTANITKSGAGEDPDGYLLQGSEIDASEIIISELILDLDDKLLCRGDCAGLCQRCGADLNIEECDCKPDTDPRLAVLGQLLE